DVIPPLAIDEFREPAVSCCCLQRRAAPRVLDRKDRASLWIARGELRDEPRHRVAGDKAVADKKHAQPWAIAANLRQIAADRIRREKENLDRDAEQQPADDATSDS